MKPLIIGGKTFLSRLFVGTGKFSSNQLMKAAIEQSATEIVTIAMKRIDLKNENANMMDYIDRNRVQLLPNTSGARNAKEAIFAAQMSREIFETNWLKLEIHPDQRYLLPDVVETIKATESLAKMGFAVLPYTIADPVTCKLLEEAGAATVMPLGSPIGSNKGLKTRDLLEIIIEQSNIPVIIDAGIGTPSDAAEAMEMGADAVLINTAIAVAGDPIAMAQAFKLAVEAGRIAFEAEPAAPSKYAEATSPLTAFLSE
jgi:thiazole synthase